MSGNEVPFMSYVSEAESLEFFVEGLKQSSSAARQLARLQDHPIWDDISKILDEMNNSGVELAHSKPLSRQGTLNALDIRQNKMAVKLEEKRPSKLIVN